MRYGYNQLPLILGVIGTCFPIITVLIMLFVEPELFYLRVVEEKKDVTRPHGWQPDCAVH